MMNILRPFGGRELWAGGRRAAVVLSGGLALGLLAAPSFAEGPAAAAVESQAAEQPHTASDMSHLYRDTPKDCGGATRPAFLCSGIILRVTRPGDYHAWEPSPASQKSGGVSFSYIRADAKFDQFAFGETNGFTLYPILGNLRAPADKKDLNVLCAFPVDGGTGSRTDAGCGGHAAFPVKSVQCQQQNILTANQWIAHYKAAPNNPPFYQCGFDVSDHSKNATADAFYQTLLAMKMLGTASFKLQNELRLATWSQDWAKELPIQSFFYSGGAPSRANAQKDQKDYYNVTHEFVPVIQITVPKQPTQDFDFHFNPQDQAVPIPS